MDYRNGTYIHMPLPITEDNYADMESIKENSTCAYKH